ncbi:oxidoreductase [Bacillus sp. J14TS2]|uniref:SDR family NAD(P)-dependent oxidoreductase n=1 Tax=Bacillus sp. J14TS2 TaxID=2807188 RepID=UPI001B03020E|nr:SDR family oxidoreductase [Bacillus sp. J14TS2]GIN73501.1 oxidoreductase [Bacillus sp. J14TS2]
MKKNKRIQGKIIVITGASGGLGRALAEQCAQHGADLFLLARREELLTELADHLQETYKVNCTAIKLDVTSRDDIQHVFSHIREKVGKIDVFINNAGYGIFAKAERANIEEVEKMFAVNVLGLIACTKEAIPLLRSSKSAHIINIASQAGKLATPKSSAYAATKHAVLGYTDSLRMELSADRIFVTAVNPGPIRTHFFEQTDPNGEYLDQLGRVVLEPDDVAKQIVRAMLTSKREINLPWWMNVAATLHILMPRIVEKIGKKAFYKK